MTSVSPHDDALNTTCSRKFQVLQCFPLYPKACFELWIPLLDQEIGSTAIGPPRPRDHTCILQNAFARTTVGESAGEDIQEMVRSIRVVNLELVELIHLSAGSIQSSLNVRCKSMTSWPIFQTGYVLLKHPRRPPLGAVDAREHKLTDFCPPDHPHPSPRDSFPDLARALCGKTQAASAEIRECQHITIIHQIS